MHLVGYCLAAAFIALVATALVSGTPILELLGIMSSATPSMDSEKGGWSGWVFWPILLGFVALPAILAVSFDGKGQAASGWVYLIGIGISIFLGVLYLFAYVLWSFVSLLF